MSRNKRNPDGSINGYYVNQEKGFGFYIPFEDVEFASQIEPGVLKSVIILNQCGYRTLTSCEGHPRHLYELGLAIRYNEGPQITVGFEELSELYAFESKIKELTNLDYSVNPTIDFIKTVKITCGEDVIYPDKCKIIEKEIEGAFAPANI